MIDSVDFGKYINISKSSLYIMTLTPDDYMPRLIDQVIAKRMRSCGAVYIKGPKYSGKTWTARNNSRSAYNLEDPREDYRNRRLARFDPFSVLEGDEPRMIDEWQTVPAIWDAVRQTVDGGSGKGRFILCGSSTPDDEGSSGLHTGFGRICTLHMHTMSLFETGDSDGSVSLYGMFEGDDVRTASKETSLEQIASYIVRGGWPANLGLDPEDASSAAESLIDEIVENDLPRISPGANEGTMRRLIRSLARNESTLATDKTIRSDMRRFPDDGVIDQSTLVKYESILRRLNLIEEQPAFNPNLRSSVRVGKSPKRHLADPSLAASALNVGPKVLLRDHETLGFLFESLCQHDLRIYAETLGGRLHHYRDADGREIDAVVELRDGRWGAFEIKLTGIGIDEGAHNLARISEYISRDPGATPPTFLCVICGTEPFAYRREDGVYVVPITSLRE